MIPKERYNQYSYSTMKVKGITIHNTGNTMSAEENYLTMLDLPYSYSTHYFVDEKEVIQCLPNNRTAWHTGKGFDAGNMSTISIEICRSRSNDDLYQQAEERAIKLVKELMDHYELTYDDIYFHQDFDRNKYCPHKILNDYGNKINWINEKLKGDNL